MAQTTLTVRFAVVDGSSTLRTYVGDLGFVPAKGMTLDFGVTNGRRITTRVVAVRRVQVGTGAAEAQAEANLQLTLLDAQQLLADFNTRAAALGLTVQP